MDERFSIDERRRFHAVQLTIAFLTVVEASVNGAIFLEIAADIEEYLTKGKPASAA